MSIPDQHPRQDDDTEPQDPKAEDKSSKDSSADAPGKGLKYVFKISPADPKNNLDFEDVADK